MLICVCVCVLNRVCSRRYYHDMIDIFEKLLASGRFWTVWACGATPGGGGTPKVLKLLRAQGL